MSADQGYEALLVLSFGGPNCLEDVPEFLRRVTEGKRIPAERIAEVAERYELFGGRSPHNEHVQALLVAISESFRRQGLPLALYWGNRYWHPFVAEAIAEMASEGIRRALALILTPFGSYSGCRQYLRDVELAREQWGGGAPQVDRLRLFFNHPLFIAAVADRVNQAATRLPECEPADRSIVFTAHSLPLFMAAKAPYAKQFAEASRLVAEQLGISRYELAYQSRSGSPTEPWLEPDLESTLRKLHHQGVKQVIVVPIGFLIENMETIFDLDTEAAALAEDLGLQMARASTVGNHPQFVAMVQQLVQERLNPAMPRAALGPMGPWPDRCPDDCCLLAECGS